MEAWRLSAVAVVTMSAPAPPRARSRASTMSKPVAAHVAHEFLGRGGIDVVDAQALDAEHGLERERLELRLRAVADHRHPRAVRPRQLARGQRRGRGGAQRGEHGHLATHPG